VFRCYLDQCLKTVKFLDTFTIYHIPREENSRANCLAQQASGYYISKGKNCILQRPMLAVLRSDTLLDIRLVQPAVGFDSVRQLALHSKEEFSAMCSRFW
jgi:hypothetical protein